MSIIVTNELTIPAERAEEVAAKFAANSQRLPGADGFEGFQLCRPTDPADDRWLVITQWRDEDAYQAWRQSSHFHRSHPQDSNAPARGAKAQSVIRHYQVETSNNPATTS
ncbi:MAG: antibiotic biosynthesis monooxygenase family protein [Actinomycetaceae bacterium]|nr:antibiotic biosynthesis monooxygenase family protein [Actinomycetaceae bacterium]